jgi:hypothetical protein
MAGVYAELRGYVLAHRKCAGPRRTDASLPSHSGYSLRVKCGCGEGLTLWATPEDADEDLLRSALLAFEN